MRPTFVTWALLATGFSAVAGQTTPPYRIGVVSERGDVATYAPDSKLAYVSCESIGSDSGAVDVIDLGARKWIASIPIAGQPTGITLLPSHSTHPRP